MVGILGNILAGGVAGGAKEYTGVMDDRIEDKREAEKAAALEKRMRSMAKYRYDLERQATMEDRGYAKGLLEEAKAEKNTQDFLKAQALYGESAEGASPDLIGRQGADAYDVPTGTRDEIKGALSGSGLLEVAEKERAMEKESRAEAMADEKFEMDKETTRLTQKKLEEELKHIGKEKWVPRDLYKDGKEVKAMTQAEYLMYRKDGFTPIKNGDGASAGELAGFKAMEFGGVAGMDAPKDKEVWEFFDNKGAQRFKRWADENGVIYAATPMGKEGEGERFLISTKYTATPKGGDEPAKPPFDENKSYTKEEALQMGARVIQQGPHKGKVVYPMGNGKAMVVKIKDNTETSPPPEKKPGILSQEDLEMKASHVGGSERVDDLDKPNQGEEKKNLPYGYNPHAGPEEIKRAAQSFKDAGKSAESFIKEWVIPALQTGQKMFLTDPIESTGALSQWVWKSLTDAQKRSISQFRGI